MRYVIGADVGTTRVKGLLFEEGGRLVASSWREYRCRHARPGWSEQDAMDWLLKLGEVTRELADGIDPGGVAALSLATQGGTLVPTDGDGRPLREAIVWNDMRCEAERALLDPDYVWRTTGWTLGQGLNALQLLWLREHEPQVFARAARFLSVPDFLSLRLAGACVIDPSNAGINQLADIDKNVWDARLLNEVGVREHQLARIIGSGEVIGRLSREGAGALGLTERTLLVSGGHDQWCAALGAGAQGDGDVFIATGTCWVVASISATRPQRNCVGRHTVPGLWGQLLSHPSGGASLEWLRARLSDGGPLSYEQINREVAEAGGGEGAPMFYPYLTGSVYPEADASLRGAFLGLSASTARGDLLRAAMEGVCLQARWMMDSFDTSALSSVCVTGGASRSQPWMRLLAGVTGLPVEVPEISESGCVGAAVLAGTAAGLFPSLRQGCERLNRGRRIVSASPQEIAVSAARLTAYKHNTALLAQMK